MEHRISVGALVVDDGKILLVRQRITGKYDFWSPPGGGVQEDEELEAAVEREVLEETGIVVRAKHLAYIDELIDESGRMVKFWFISEYLEGKIDITNNPAEAESIVNAGWFSKNTLPSGHVFPEMLKKDFWKGLEAGIEGVKRLPLMKSIF